MKNNNVLPVVTKAGNTHQTLQNHLDTLLEAAKSHDKTLKMTTKAYHQLLSLLIEGAKGKQELTKTQIDCIKVVLGEHKHLNKLVSDIEELIKKIRVGEAVEEGVAGAEMPTGQPKTTEDLKAIMRAKLEQQKLEAQQKAANIANNQ